jgi:thiol:disulfide interchange protein
VRQHENGIDFKKISLDKAKKLAAQEGKLIFIDAYTSWCGPCKKMAKTTFMDGEVGELFNENFINIKIEMEKDADGPDVARRYNVRAYPTLLIIDDEGNLVKQTIGFQDKSKLMNFAEAVL